jgi:hypothetical protein
MPCKALLNGVQPRQWKTKDVLCEILPQLHVIVAYEAIKYPQPLVPQVRCIHSHWEHTVMTVLPRKEEGKLFLEWTRELKERRETMIRMNKNQLEWKSNT